MPTSYTWNNTTGNWNSAGDWTPTSGPPGTGSAVGADVFMVDMNAAYFVTILGGQSFDISSLSIGANNAGHRATLDVYGVLKTDTLTFTTSGLPAGGDALIRVNAGGEMDIRTGLFASSPETIQVWGRDAGGRLVLGGYNVNAINVTFSFINNSSSSIVNTGIIEFQNFTTGQTFAQKIIGWGIGDKATF